MWNLMNDLGICWPTPEVECTILVPQVSSLESSQIIPLCDLSGGTILQLEVVLAKNNPNDIRPGDWDTKTESPFGFRLDPSRNAINVL